MKNVILFVMIVFTAATTALSHPVIHIAKDKVFTLDLKSWAGNTYHVSIISENGTLAYQDKFTANSPALKNFDVSNLTTGTYTVKVYDALKSISYDLLVSPRNITLIGMEEVKYTPVVRMNGTYLDLDFLALNQETTINVYDASGRVIYNEVIKNTPVYNRRLQLQSLKKGTFFVEFKTPSKVYSSSVEL